MKITVSEWTNRENTPDESHRMWWVHDAENLNGDGHPDLVGSIFSPEKGIGETKHRFRPSESSSDLTATDIRQIFDILEKLDSERADYIATHCIIQLNPNPIRLGKEPRTALELAQQFLAFSPHHGIAVAVEDNGPLSVRITRADGLSDVVVNGLPAGEIKRVMP